LYLCGDKISLMLTPIQKNKVINSMVNILNEQREFIIEENQKDLDAFKGDDKVCMIVY